MRLTEIRRFPVKSMLGEVLPAAEVTGRGLAGDRAWAVRDVDGKFGSGKNTRRFRRMPGLFTFRARAAALTPATAGPPPIVELPDGRCFAADDPAGHRAVSEVLGRTVTLTPEAAIPHHDEGPVSLITTASLRALTALSGPEPDGSRIDPLRFRANLLIDIPGAGVPGAGHCGDGVAGLGVSSGEIPGPGIRGRGVPGLGFPEDDWPDRRLRIGAEVVLRVVRPLTRCVMIDMAQDGVSERGDLLKCLATRHEMTFGVFATVETPGRISAGDECRWA